LASDHVVDLGNGYFKDPRPREIESTLFHELTHYYIGTDDGTPDESRLFYAKDLDDISKGFEEYVFNGGTFKLIGPVTLTPAEKLHTASAYEAYFRTFYLPH
jgi:hypothetical protein